MSCANWTRPCGPPIIWKTIEAVDKTKDDTTSRVRLLIQDIPEDRYEEAIDHMCEYYLGGQEVTKYLKIKECPIAVNDFRLIWEYILKQGMSIGIFKINEFGELGELIAMSVLSVLTDENGKRLKKLKTRAKSSRSKKYFRASIEFSGKVDIRKTYEVDKYLIAVGFSVKPSYRGQRLGVHLLEARTDIGRKYGIPVTSTVFTGPSSQIQAERAGFQTLVTMRYSEFLDEDGQPLFPNIEADVLKVMVKKL